MDQDDNGNPCNFSSGDDVGANETRLADGNFGQKRKRGDGIMSASSTTQNAGEAAVESLLLLGQRRKEDQNTSSQQQQQQQLEDIDRYRLQNEQLRRENEELKKQLQGKDEENIKLREELEKEKQKRLQTDHSNDDQPKSNIVTTTTTAPLDMYDVSTDTDAENDMQLSSNSSMKQHQLNHHRLHEWMNDNDDNTSDVDSGEKREASLNFHQSTGEAEVCADTLSQEEDAVDDIATANTANAEQKEKEDEEGDDDDGQLTIREAAGED